MSFAARFDLQELPVKNCVSVHTCDKIGGNIGSALTMQPRAFAQRTATLVEPIKLYESIRGESPRRENRARALKETICDVVRSPKRCFTRIRHRVSRYIRICSSAFARVVSARVQEAAAVILQIISCEHAILLKITRLRRGQAMPYCTFRPLFSRTCAHTRPRDTRGFRRAQRPRMSRETHAEAAVWWGCLPTTVINSDVKACGSSDVSFALDNDAFPLNAARENRAYLIVYSARCSFVNSILQNLKMRM